MKQQNWNKTKINLPLSYEGHPGVRYTKETGQISVGDCRTELQKLGITEDIYELLDAAPCEERYGMITPGFDSIVKLVSTRQAWAVAFGRNSTSDLWAVVRVESGDGPATLLRMDNGGIGTLISFHSCEENAAAAMTAYR